ncbi:lectin C-type domain protein [Oesophagostomum dentatum]|uniref:Lectin C-type domain protein n=1 Tax=Oesophagostomum dentatum TaxID=61180 RepID=A0A0B1TJQ9_OESDE|nr:lectin C-type domain protein [Oesophagostomum dentatum]
MLFKLITLWLVVKFSVAEEYDCPCYTYVHQNLTKESARKECEKYKGYGLVTIPSYKFNVYVQQLSIAFLGLTYGSFWTGLSENPATKIWEWDDGMPLQFKYWAKGNNDERKCATMRVADGRWVKSDCLWKYQAMCSGPAHKIHDPTTKGPEPEPTKEPPGPEPDPTKEPPGPEPDPTKEPPGPEPDPTKEPPGPEPDPTKEPPGPEPDPTKEPPGPEPDPTKEPPGPKPDPTKEPPGPEPDPTKEPPGPEPDPTKEPPGPEPDPTKEPPGPEPDPTKEPPGPEPDPTKEPPGPEPDPTKELETTPAAEITTPAPPRPCKDGYYHNKDNNMCYIFIPQFEHVNLTHYLECVIGSSIEDEQEEKFVRGLLKYYDPELPGCKLTEDRHYFVGRILNSKEGGKSYTSCHKAQYCTDKSNKCDIEWKEGPNYVFIKHTGWSTADSVDACFYLCKYRSLVIS